MKELELSVKCPILGFEDVKHMKYSVIDDFFSRVEGVEDKKCLFVLTDPTFLRTDYEFDLPTYYQELLQITKDSKNYKVYVIVALAKNIQESSVNFLAPIIINFDNNSMVQAILESRDYPNFFQADKISNYVHNKPIEQELKDINKK